MIFRWTSWTALLTAVVLGELFGSQPAGEDRSGSDWLYVCEQQPGFAEVDRRAGGLERHMETSQLERGIATMA